MAREKESLLRLKKVPFEAPSKTSAVPEGIPFPAPGGLQEKEDPVCGEKNE
ncbi:UNVERIFIED_CONTAM: hypothetical protein Sradi_3810100 [Sesamum radiatum]|uniref:Uncharacterized protein n=1 Tax=Sesamum radiatum TaxID=300843 RepID=A0AAW2Q0C1_SESRA